MSSITKYYCDQCKKEVSTSSGLISVKAETNHYGGYRYHSEAYEGRLFTKDLCVECAKKLGVLQQKNQITETPKTTDNKDLLYDIIAQIVEEAVQK